MLIAPECLDEPTLEVLAEGRLPEAAADALESHLAECWDCRSRYEARFSSVADALRTVFPTDTDPDQPLIDDLVDRLLALAPLPTPMPVAATSQTPAADVPTGPWAEYRDVLSPPRAVGEIGWLGPYRVLGKLGEGGMGFVFEAEEPHTGRKVALKVIKGGGASPDARRRFLREGRAAASLEHEHVVPIWQVGEENGNPYIAMPLLRGEALSSRLKAGPLSVVDALRVVREAAEGLAAAHAVGLVHRDIKPANLWLEERGGGWRVKVLDFGLAHGGATTDGHEPLTHSGALVGTPQYMAPEQARGESADPRSDVFALGAVVYECLTGSRPFVGESLTNVLSAVLTLDPPPAHTVKPAVPPAVSDLAARMLAKNPADRPASMQAVIDEIVRLEAGGPEPSPPQKNPFSGFRWAMTAVAAAAMIAVAGFIVVKVKSPDGQETTITTDGKVSLRVDGSIVVTPPTKTPASKKSTPPLPQQEVPLIIQPPVQPPPTRRDVPAGHGLAWERFVGDFAKPLGKEIVSDVSAFWSLPTDHGGAESCRWTGWLKPPKAGKYALTLAQEGNARLTIDGKLISGNWDRPAATEVQQVEVDLPAEPVELLVEYRRVPLRGHCVLSWEPAPAPATTGWPLTARYLFTTREEAIKATVPPLVLPTEVPVLRRLEWGVDLPESPTVTVSPDGKLVAAGGGEMVGVWDLARGDRLWRETVGTRMSAVAFTPDGKELLCAGYQSEIPALDPATGKVLRSLTGTRSKERGLAVSRDGKRMATFEMKAMAVWQLDAGRVLRTDSSFGQVDAVAWMPDDRRVAFTSSKHPSMQIFDPETAKIESIPCPAGIPCNLSLSWLSGRAVAVSPRTNSSGMAVQFDLDALKVTRTWCVSRSSTARGALSPDGRLYAVSAVGGPTRLWDLDTGAELARFGEASDVTLDVAFTPDGQHLIAAGRAPKVMLRVWAIPPRPQAEH